MRGIDPEMFAFVLGDTPKERAAGAERNRQAGIRTRFEDAKTTFRERTGDEWREISHEAGALLEAGQKMAEIDRPAAAQAGELLCEEIHNPALLEPAFRLLGENGDDPKHIDEVGSRIIKKTGLASKESPHGKIKVAAAVLDHASTPTTANSAFTLLSDNCRDPHVVDDNADKAIAGAGKATAPEEAEGKVTVAKTVLARTESPYTKASAFELLAQNDVDKAGVNRRARDLLAQAGSRPTHAWGSMSVAHSVAVNTDDPELQAAARAQIETLETDAVADDSLQMSDEDMRRLGLPGLRDPICSL